MSKNLTREQLSEVKRKAANARWNKVREQKGLPVIQPVQITEKPTTKILTREEFSDIKRRAANARWNRVRELKGLPVVDLTQKANVVKPTAKKQVDIKQTRSEAAKKAWAKRRANQGDNVAVIKTKKPMKKIIEVLKNNLPDAEEHPDVSRNDIDQNKHYWRVLTQNKIKESDDFENYAYNLQTLYTITRDLDPEEKSTDEQLKQKKPDIDSIHVKYDGKAIYLVAGSKPGSGSLVANIDGTLNSLLIWAYRLLNKLIPDNEGGTIAFQYILRQQSIDYDYYKTWHNMTDINQINKIKNPKLKTTLSLRSAPVGGNYRTNYYKYPVLDALNALYIWAFHEDSDSVGSEETNVIRVLPFFRKRIENVRVAKHQLGNCFMELIKNELESRRDSKRTFTGLIDKHFDMLCNIGVLKVDPTLSDFEVAGNNVSVNFDEMFKLAKMFEFNLSIYSQFGKIVGLPWKDSKKNEHFKSIKVCVSNNHCNIMKSIYKITKIVYVDDTYDGMVGVLGGQFVDVIESRQNEFGKYYIRYNNIDKETTIYKTWKPSAYGLKVDIDDLPDYYRCLGVHEVLYKQFVDRFTIMKTPLDLFSIIRSACLFFGKRMINSISESVVKIDHNKSYSSYKNCKYYIGFPGDKLRLAHRDIDDLDEIAFIIGSPKIIPDKHKLMYDTLYGDMSVFTRPMYKFLCDLGFIFEIRYKVITNDYKNVDIWDFLSEYDGIIKPSDKKLCLNSFLGKTICGGISPTRTYHFTSSDVDEMKHINDEIHKTFKGIIPVIPSFDSNQQNIVGLRADLPRVNNGSYHFYSYILQYSHIQVMTKWIDLEASGAKVCGYHVDSLIIEPNNCDLNLTPDIVGGWKLELDAPNTYNKYKKQPLVPDSHRQLQPIGEIKIDSLPKKILLPYKRYVINGPAGIGKSFPFISDPYDDCILLTPTVALRESHIKTYNNIMSSDEYTDEQKALISNMRNQIHTAAKYFQFSMMHWEADILRHRGTIPAACKNVIIDEGCMFDRLDFEKILSVVNSHNSNLCVLLDFDQIHKELSGNIQNAVTIDYFERKGFTIIDMNRNDDDTHTRHKLQYGRFLDSLRGRELDSQKEIIHTSGLFNKVIVNDYTSPELLNYDHIIVGTHFAARKINSNYANTHEFIKCRLKARSLVMRDDNIEPYTLYSGQVVNLRSDDKRIWYDRSKFDDVIPKKKYFEPVYAATVDSFQGTTISSGKIAICIYELKKHGSLYSAITRTKTPEQVTLVYVRYGNTGDKKIDMKDDIIKIIDSKTDKFDDMVLASISMKTLIQMQRLFPKFIKINPEATKQLQAHYKELLLNKNKRVTNAVNIKIDCKSDNKNKDDIHNNNDDDIYSNMEPVNDGELLFDDD